MCLLASELKYYWFGIKFMGEEVGNAEDERLDRSLGNVPVVDAGKQLFLGDELG